MSLRLRLFPALAVLSAALFPLSGCSSVSEPTIRESNSTNMSNPRLVSASDGSFLYEGRFDFSNPGNPVISWQGTRVRTEFTGPALTVRFGPAVDQNVFNLTVDDRTEVLVVPAGKSWNFNWPHALGNGRHQLMLFKRSEASAGHAGFLGVEIAAGAEVKRPVAPEYKLRMEFFGDSITAGACNEDGETDQWEDRRTHNHALSYSTLTAAAFAADYRCAAVSGMGISMGYVDVKAGQAWDKIYPRADSPRADLKIWQPDVAFVNLGENDDSFSRKQGQSFPASYRPGYVALVRAIRAAYPHTQLVLLRGGMWGGAKSPELRPAWEAVVREVEASDPAISHYVFEHWSPHHPRVSDDRAMADELTSWLKKQSFMKKFLKD